MVCAWQSSRLALRCLEQNIFQELHRHSISTHATPPPYTTRHNEVLPLLEPPPKACGLKYRAAQPLWTVAVFVQYMDVINADRCHRTLR